MVQSAGLGESTKRKTVPGAFYFWLTGESNLRDTHGT